MEQEIRWEVGCHKKDGAYQIELNGKVIGEQTFDFLRAQCILGWMCTAGPDIAKVISKELMK